MKCHQQPVADLIVEAVHRQVPQRVDGALHLVEVPVAAITFGEMVDEPPFGIRVELAFQLRGDKLDETRRLGAARQQKVSDLVGTPRRRATADDKVPAVYDGQRESAMACDTGNQL